MGKKRKEIEIYNTLLFLMVVFIHVSSRAITGFSKDSAPLLLLFIPWKAASFVVPGFLFLSAFKLSLKFSEKKIPYGEFIRGRARAILLPYFLWVILYYLYFVYVLHYFPFEISSLLSHLLLGTISSPFYFIVVLFQFYLTFPWWMKLSETPRMALPVFFVLTVLFRGYLPQALSSWFSLSFPYNDRILTSYAFFFLLGCAAGRNREAFEAFLLKNKGKLALLYGLAAVLFVFFGYESFIGRRFLPGMEVLNGFFLLFSVLFFYLACLYLKGKRVSDILCALSPVSFYVYLIHCLILSVADEFLRKAGIVSLTASFFLRGFAAYFFSIFLSFLYLVLKKRAIFAKQKEKAAR